MYPKKGFTLLEVLIVVVIAVSVAAFSVPAYKKMQDRNRYMAAQGVLIDVGSGIRALELDENCSFLEDRRPYLLFIGMQEGTLEEDEDGPCLPIHLFDKGYVSPIPFDEGGHSYKGYKIYTCGETWQHNSMCLAEDGLRVIAYIQDDDYASRATKGQYYGAVYLEDGTIKRIAK